MDELDFSKYMRSQDDKVDEEESAYEATEGAQNHFFYELFSIRTGKADFE